MRKVKFAFWVILAGLIGLIVSQNLPFFLEPKHLLADFYFAKYQTPELPMALYFLALFFAGLLISYASGLSEKFIAKRTIRKLNVELAAGKKKLSELEGNIASLKSEAARREPEVPVIQTDLSESTPL
ncbi:MAG: hypothetical protein C4518_15515 [Desulfobacteraceae bacterium]|nr:MAG: hypothetical protein C4518_15515 [Desulfobacteraceae bacterium]